MNLVAVKKLLKEVSKKKPILGCLHYDVGLNLLEVCDTFSLIQEKVKLNIVNDLNIDINTGKEILGNYPETSRIKPDGERIHIQKDGGKTLSLQMKNNKLCYEYDGRFWDAKLINKAFACLDKKPLEVLEKENGVLFVILKSFSGYLIYDNEISGQYILSMGLRYEREE